MSVSTCVPNQAKLDFLNGVHLASHTYKGVLIKTGHTGTYDKNVTAAGTPGSGAPSTSNLGTDAVPASGTYEVAGQTLSGRSVALSGDTGYLDFANLTQLTGFTGSADGIMIYNDSVAGKPVVYIGAFANAPVAATNGTFDCTIPTSGNGVVEMT